MGAQMIEDYRPRGHYKLAFGHDSITVELEAHDRADALAQAQKLVKVGRPATLLEDDVPLGQISYSPAGFWTVSEDGARVA